MSNPRLEGLAWPPPCYIYLPISASMFKNTQAVDWERKASKGPLVISLLESVHKSQEYENVSTNVQIVPWIFNKNEWFSEKKKRKRAN